MLAVFVIIDVPQCSIHIYSEWLEFFFCKFIYSNHILRAQAFAFLQAIERSFQSKLNFLEFWKVTWGLLSVRVWIFGFEIII